MATPELNSGNYPAPPLQPERRLRAVREEQVVEPDIFSTQLGKDVLRVLRDEAPDLQYHEGVYESPDQ
jgi:hypothetical protein